MVLLGKNFVYLLVLFLIGYGAARWGAGRDLRRLMGPRYVVAYAITMFAGFFSPNVWLYHLVTIAAFLATTRDREDAICRYVVMIGLTAGVSTLVQLPGGLYLGTYGGTIGISIAMAIASFVKPDRERRVPAARGWRVEDTLAVALFLIFSIGSVHMTTVTSWLRTCLITGSDLLLPFWLVRRNVRSAEGLQRVIGCLAFSSISIAVIALFEARSGWPLYDAIVYRLSSAYALPAATNLRGGMLRAMVAFTSPLGLALFFLVAFAAWLCSRRMFAKPIAWQLGVPLLVLGTLAPQSRGILVSLVPAFMVLLAARRRFAAAAALLAGAGLGGGALFVLQHSSARIAAFLGSGRTGDYYDYRGLLLDRGLQEGMKHWLFGQSYEQVIASLRDITQGQHIVDLVNAYLTIFLFTGVIGLVPVVVCLALTLRKLIARAPRGATMEAVRDSRAFLLAVLVGFLVYLYGNSFSERAMTYTAVLLAMARLGSALLVREKRVARPATRAAAPARAGEHLVTA